MEGVAATPYFQTERECRKEETEEGENLLEKTYSTTLSLSLSLFRCIETQVLEEGSNLWNWFSRFDYLVKVCISPNPERLKRLLSREWLDTGILQNWFDTFLKPKAPNAYFNDTNASDIWLREDKHNYIHIFGENGRRVGEMQKHEIIIVPMCYLEHFTVIVGYPNAKRWDYYNSMPGDSRHWEMAVQFIHWLNDSFAAYKWEEPMVWRRRIVENVPLQENSHDCGFFVMASVEHVVLNRKFEFTQRDMMYFRCKLVINQYNRQLELYKRREQQSG